MATARRSVESEPPGHFVVEVFSELSPEVLQQSFREVNVLLRLSMLASLEMDLEATLNMLCDFAAEIAPFDRALVYFWDEGAELPQLRLARGFEPQRLDGLGRSNVLNYWATRSSRPLLATRGHHSQADALLDQAECSSALALPLLVNNRVLGTLQLLARDPAGYSPAQAQLLWILALIAENLLTRDQGNEGLLRFAFTDYLTGLKTRGYFEQQLEMEIKRSERKQQPLALLMVDIDHFKALNDNHGHHVGDQVLRDVASLLMKEMREIDTAARYGGEEFVLILPETSAPGAVRVATRLRRTVEQSRFFAGSAQKVEHLTISIGVSIFDKDAQFKRELIECADAALYAAKNQGRNQVALYSEIAPRKRVS